jgi:manganese/zinc/iron transport system substrate-binding protein
LRVRGLQGISTASEYGLQDISNLVTFIVNEKIPAVFVESSVPKKSIEAVISGCRSRGHNVMLGGQLYSDALGEAGTETGTLIGAFKANVEAITYGLTAKNTATP